jgi:hypothetical protein
MKRKVQEDSNELIYSTKYRRTMGRENTPKFQKLLGKIVELRDSGMTSNAVAQALEIDRSIIYNHTVRIPGVVQSKEALQLILASKALKMSVSSFVLLMFSEWGVEFVQKNGDSEHVQGMLQVAAGDDFEG